MATSRTVLRQRISEVSNDYWASTTSGAGTTTTLLDTALKSLVENDGDLAQLYIYFTSGTAANIGKSRRILLTAGFTWSTGTCTWANALGSITASGDGYELHRINPDLKNNGINRAAEELSRYLPLPITDETLVVDNLLSNPDMETFSSGFTGWTEVGSPTVTQESAIIMHGTYSCKMVSSGTAVGLMYQALTINLNAISGKTLTFKAWVYASAGTTRIGLSFDGGSTFTYSDYHSGDADWELLFVTATIPSTATSIRLYLAAGTASAAATSYFDACRAWVDPLYRLTVPSAITSGIPSSISQQVDEQDDSNTANYKPLSIYNSPISGRRLRVEGRGTLTRPASESATMEVSNQYVNLIVDGALAWMHRALAGDTGGGTRDLDLQQMTLWKQEMQSLIQDFGTREPASTADDGMTRGWHARKSGETAYIQLHGGR